MDTEEEMKLALIESGADSSASLHYRSSPTQRLFCSFRMAELNRKLRLLPPASLAAIFHRSRTGAAQRDSARPVRYVCVCVCLARNARAIKLSVIFTRRHTGEDCSSRAAKRIISIMSCRVYTYAGAH